MPSIYFGCCCISPLYRIINDNSRISFLTCSCRSELWVQQSCRNVLDYFPKTYDFTSVCVEAHLTLFCSTTLILWVEVPCHQNSNWPPKESQYHPQTWGFHGSVTSPGHPLRCWTKLVLGAIPGLSLLLILLPEKHPMHPMLCFLSFTQLSFRKRTFAPTLKQLSSFRNFWWRTCQWLFRSPNVLCLLDPLHPHVYWDPHRAQHRNDAGFPFTEAALTLSQQTVIHVLISLTLHYRHHSFTTDGSQTHQPFLIVRGLHWQSTSALAQRH